MGSNGVDFLSTDGDVDPDDSSVCVQVVVRHLQGSSAVEINVVNDREAAVGRLCRHAVDRSCGGLLDINIDYFGTDDLLKYITDG